MRKLPWFLAWYAVGAGALFSLLALLSVGPYLALPVLVAAVLLARSARARAGLAGAVAGLGLPLLWVAALNADGPGEVCNSSASSTSCTDEWSPWPWLAVGLLLTVGGVVLARLRTSSGARGNVAAPRP